jgi:hypothetical protein
MASSSSSGTHRHPKWHLALQLHTNNWLLLPIIFALENNTTQLPLMGKLPDDNFLYAKEGVERERAGHNFALVIGLEEAAEHTYPFIHVGMC